MNKSAFTLIELLIVILIIGILAGAVLPFVQQYVEESRYTRARQDLDEIKNALIRYETDQRNLYSKPDTRDLIGPYLLNAKPDPWGRPYAIDSDKSLCYSHGPDGLADTGDEVKTYFRPPLALSRAQWEDSNGTMQVDSGDTLVLRFTRPLRDLPADGPQTDVGLDDFEYSAGAPDLDYTTPVFYDNRMSIRLPVNYNTTTPFRAGQDTIWVKDSSSIVDGEGMPCKPEQATLIRPR